MIQLTIFLIVAVMLLSSNVAFASVSFSRKSSSSNGGGSPSSDNNNPSSSKSTPAANNPLLNSPIIGNKQPTTLDPNNVPPPPTNAPSASSNSPNLCPDGITPIPANGICVQAVPQPTQQSQPPNLMQCQNGQLIDLNVQQCPVTPSSTSSSSGSTSHSSTHHKSGGKGSTSITDNSTEIKRIENCFNESSTVYTLDFVNTTTAKNQTDLVGKGFISQLNSALHSCITDKSLGLVSETTTQPKTLIAGIITTTTTQPATTKASSHSKDFTIGYHYGKKDAAFGIRDAAGSCNSAQGFADNDTKGITQCTQGYTAAYNVFCVNAKFGCNS